MARIERRAMAREARLQAARPSAIPLDLRLQAVEDLTPRCETAADIGCDHGYLGVRLLLDDRCQRVLFSEISAKSLVRARGLVEQLALTSRAAFCLGDGAAALPIAPQCAIIAGMGGTTISQIITEGQPTLADAALVLSPNIDVTEVRTTLMRLHYCIDDERIVRAGRRWYIVLRAVPGGTASYSEAERIVGPVLLRERPEALADYAAFRARVAHEAMIGASVRDVARAKGFEAEAEIWDALSRRTSSASAIDPHEK